MSENNGKDLSKVEQLLRQPGVGHKIIRQIIATQAGESTSVKTDDAKFLTATILRQCSNSIYK